MAIFILRGKYASRYLPPDATGTVFTDVPVTAFAANWIEKFAAEGITTGCGVKLYCPDNPVTRGEMAVFLLRAKYGSGYSPAPPVGIFGDVTPGVPFAKWIEKLSADGITAGCGGGNYCPTLANTRGQMAVFLTKTFAESSQALIAEALAYGDIDYPTSLLDRAYALFWDRRLPPRYIGAGSNGEDLGFFEEVKAVWDELTPQAQDSLEPFLVRPDDPVSVFGPAPAGTRPTRVQAATSCATQWVGKPSPAGNFYMNVCSSGDLAADGVLLDGVGQTADGLWDKETDPPPAGLGFPVQDEGGSDDKIDIYVIATNRCSPRDPNNCIQIKEGKELAVALNTEPYEINLSGGVRSSGYILVSAAELSDPTFKSTLAHEFFHVLQMAHNQGARFRNRGSWKGKTIWQECWFVEASAKWAEWNYVPETHELAVHPFFREFQKDDDSLLEWRHSRHMYGSYLWPLFTEQEKGGPSPVFAAWVEAEGKSNPDGITDAVDAQLSFKDHFRDFAVRNDDEELPGNPLEVMYQELDTTFPKEVWHKRTNRGTIRLLSVPPAKVRIQPLAAQYDDLFVDDAVRKLIFRFDAISKADVDVLANIKGTWKRFKVDVAKPLVFCREHPAEDVSEVIIVLSNTRKRERQVISGSYKIERKVSCCGEVAEAIAWNAHVTFNYAYSGNNLGFDIDSQQSGNISGHLTFVDLGDPKARTFETNELTGTGTIHDLMKNDFSSSAHDGSGAVQPPSSASLYFDLEQCTYIFLVHPFIDATETPPGVNFVMGVGTVVGKGLDLASYAGRLEGSGPFEARTGVWANDHPDVSVYSPDGIGSLLFKNLSSDEIEGVAGVSWTFDPVFPPATAAETPAPK